MWPKTELSEIMRPKMLRELALPRARIEIFEGMVRTGQIRSLLLSGDPGTGKTSTVQILTKAFNADVHEHTGTFTDLKPSSFSGNSLGFALEGRPVVHVIEDAEFMSRRTQAALRGWTEELLRLAPHCHFIFTTNDFGKFDRPLLSRLTHISYYLLPTERAQFMGELNVRYQKLFVELGVSLDEDRLRNIIALKFPDLRATANEIEVELMKNAATTTITTRNNEHEQSQ